MKKLALPETVEYRGSTATIYLQNPRNTTRYEATLLAPGRQSGRHRRPQRRRRRLDAEHCQFYAPYLSRARAGDRATEFGSRCRQLGIVGVSLRSYRYAWAEREKTAGMPKRFAMENLGHNSKAVHRAYAKRALMKIPSLQDYEKRAALHESTPTQ